ncbi:hypothetical protein [Lusitaniella coriacea]|uniref:hypothetical protein n=1 Tax=Lusitaniella coriacea TaxID=1983105 RepID=UPI003CF91A60
MRDSQNPPLLSTAHCLAKPWKGFTRLTKYIQERGPFSTTINQWIMKQGKLTRSAIAAKLGTTSDTITLAENVTTPSISSALRIVEDAA